ncbi:MAG: hypothetical protein AAFZ65_11245, partial [Planctomycetota bacterium]
LVHQALSREDGSFEVVGLDPDAEYEVDAGGVGYSTNAALAGPIRARPGSVVDVEAFPLYLGALVIGDPQAAALVEQFGSDYPYGIRIGSWPHGGRGATPHRNLAYLGTGLIEELEGLYASSRRYSAFTSEFDGPSLPVDVTFTMPFIDGGRQTVDIPRMHGSAVPLAVVSGLSSVPCSASVFVDFSLPPAIERIDPEQTLLWATLRTSRGWTLRKLNLSEVVEGVRFGGLPAGSLDLKVSLPGGRALNPAGFPSADTTELLVEHADQHLLFDLSNYQVVAISAGRALSDGRPPRTVEAFEPLPSAESPPREGVFYQPMNLLSQIGLDARGEATVLLPPVTGLTLQVRGRTPGQFVGPIDLSGGEVAPIVIDDL